MGRKGISPLIATVLLIAFSVGLGAVVMSWGENFIEDNAEFVTGTAEVAAGCSGIDVDVIKVKGKEQVCVTSTGISVFLDNQGESVSGVQATLVGSEGVAITSNILTTTLLQGDGRKQEFSHDAVGTIVQIKLTPTQGDTHCFDDAIILEDINTCA
jgi:flagellin-like protein